MSERKGVEIGVFCPQSSLRGFRRAVATYQTLLGRNGARARDRPQASDTLTGGLIPYQLDISLQINTL
jgi:hypothetical protein